MQPRHKATLFVVSTVQFLAPFMSSAVVVALPSIGSEFQTSAVQLGFIQIAYLLAVAVLLLPAGRLADLHGRKRVFIAGTMVFTVATIALTTATTVHIFIAIRCLQGIGAAMITSTSIAILSAVFPPERRGRAMGIVIACVYMGLAAGPTLSGVVIDQLGWRWVFYLIVPVELAALLVTLTNLKQEWAPSKGEHFDWMGTLIYMVALSLLILGATHLNKLHAARWIALGGVAGIVFFLLIEARTKQPLLDVDLLGRNLAFTFSNTANFLGHAAIFGLVFLFSLYLQSVKGLSPKQAGLILIVQPLIQVLIAPIAGRLSDSFPPGRIATIGMGLGTIGFFAAATIDTGSSIANVIGVMGIFSCGFGLFSSPNMTAIMESVASRDYGTAASVAATMRTVGMLFSMAIITTILTVFMDDQPVTAENRASFVRSMQFSFFTFSGLSMAAMAVSHGWSVSLVTSLLKRFR